MGFFRLCRSPRIRSQKKKDFQMMLACSTHLGTKNLDFQMTRYVWKRKPDGIHIINLGRTYDKLLLAARIIVAIENPLDVCVISARPYGQRSILKYCQYTGATPIAGRFTPGTFTNQITNKFMEPRLLLLTDPRTDHQAIAEAAYANVMPAPLQTCSRAVTLPYSHHTHSHSLALTLT
jgi:small subunit ribosomal protein SAe